MSDTVQTIGTQSLISKSILETWTPRHPAIFRSGTGYHHPPFECVSGYRVSMTVLLIPYLTERYPRLEQAYDPC